MKNQFTGTVRETPINMTTSELRDRASELRKALAATEAEIEVREKVADWPSAQYVWGTVRDDYGFDVTGLWSRDGGDVYYCAFDDAYGYKTAYRGAWQFRDWTPVAFVPTAEYEALAEAQQAWKDSDYTSELCRDTMTHAVKRLISAAEEVQGWCRK